MASTDTVRRKLLALEKHGVAAPKGAAAIEQAFIALVRWLVGSNEIWSRQELGAALGFSARMVGRVMNLNGIEFVPAGQPVCQCGCGRTWKWDKLNLQRKYFAPKCARVVALRKVEAGELPPDEIRKCAHCGAEFPVWLVLGQGAKQTCERVKCAVALRAAKRADTFAREQVADKKGARATHEERDGYCHQEGEGIRRVACVRYRENCGEGCARRDGSGRLICYQSGSKARQWIGSRGPAIDCTAVHGW